MRSFDDIDIGEDIDIKEAELTLARQLVDQLSKETFDPDRYEDEYRREVIAAIDRKVAGEEIVVMPSEEEKEQIIDLVAALKQSIAEKKAPAKAAASQGDTGVASLEAGRARKAAKAKGRKAARRKAGEG